MRGNVWDRSQGKIRAGTFYFALARRRQLLRFTPSQCRIHSRWQIESREQLKRRISETIVLSQYSQ